MRGGLIVLFYIDPMDHISRQRACNYHLSFFLNKKKPDNPIPSMSIVDGSGTGVLFVVALIVNRYDEYKLMGAEPVNKMCSPSIIPE